MSKNHDTSGPMDIGALRGKGRYKDMEKDKENSKVEKAKANSSDMERKRKL